MAKAPADLRSLARAHTEMGVKVLAGIASQKRMPPSARVAAVALLFERGWGKAPQDLTVDGEIKITIRKMLDVLDMTEETPPLAIEHEEDAEPGMANNR